MNKFQLRQYHVKDYGRDYNISQDGYEDIKAAENQGWKVVSSWGLNGWDMAKWPYTSVLIRTLPDTQENYGRRHQILTICEGDHSLYAFAFAANREAALNYLFMWYFLRTDLAEKEGFTSEDCQLLDDGKLTIPERFKEPFSWKRLDEFEALQSKEV